MTSWLQNWEQFILNEKVSHQGIIKLSLDDSLISQVEPFQHMLPEEAIRLAPKDLHVTLIHQSVLKPFKDKLKKIEFPDPPKIYLEEGVWERESLGKKSWAIRVANQDEIREYVAEIMKMLGSANKNPEPERVFHISLANLTGNPHDSVR